MSHRALHWILSAVLCLALGLAAQDQPGCSGPPLTSAREVHALSSRAIPASCDVLLEGVVTFSHQRWRLLFVQDQTGGISCRVPDSLACPPVGHRVEIEGYPALGALSPIVVPRRIHDLGASPFPEAKSVDARQLWAGENDGDWVRLRGHVIHTRPIQGPVPLLEVIVLDHGKEVGLIIPDPSAPEIRAGQEVEVVGACAATVDENRTLTAMNLMIAQRHQLRVVREPEEILKDLPVSKLAQLKASGQFDRERLVRLNGTVCFTSPSDLLLSDGLDGVRLVNRSGDPFSNRHDVSVMGFVSSNWGELSLEVVGFQDRGSGTLPGPVAVSALRLFEGQYLGRTVETMADFLHRSSKLSGEVLVLGEGGRTFEVILLPEVDWDVHQLKTGARLRVRGILVQAPSPQDSERVPQLMVGAANDLTIVASPPWPVARTLQVISILLVCLALGLLALALAHRRLQVLNRRAQAVDDELRRLNAELEDRIRRRTSELEAANTRLTVEVLERREAETALGEEASKRKTLLDSSRDGIVVITESGRVHEVNESFASMLGYSVEEIRYLRAWDWEPEWSRNQALSGIRAVGPEGRRYETVHRRKCGDTLEVEVTSNAAWWRGQKYIVCVCRDIRERRQAEVMRRDQTKVLEMIAQGAGLSLTLESLVQSVEAQFEGMFGSILLADEEGGSLRHEAGARLPASYRDSLGEVPVGEGIGSCGTAAFRKESCVVADLAEHPFWTAYRDLALGAGFRSCWSVPILDGARDLLGTFAVYGTTVGAPHPDQLQLLEMAVHTAAVCIRCARAKEALHRSEKRFQYAMEGSNDGLWDWDLATNRCYFSPRWKSMLGYEDHELENHLETWVRLVEPQDREPAMQMASEVIAGTRKRFETEFRLRHKQGHWITVRSQGFLVRDANGRPERIVGTHSDITQRKEEERRRAQLEIQLRQGQKMEAIGTLAGGIAHDFNNILGAIIAHAELIRLETQLSPSNSESLSDLLKASHRAKELVKQILTFSRQQEPQRLLMEFEPVLRESLSLLRAALPASVELVVRVNDPVPPVMGDATLIQQVIMNLATNAAQAIGTRVGRLDIELGPCQVDAGMAAAHQGLREGAYVRFRVRDNGPGIRPDVLDRIFEPFFTTKEPGHGTGLGLSVVHGIVHEHDGVILVESKLGSGSCFDVLLPVAAGEPKLPPERKPEAEDLHGKEHVLLIDDEPSLLRVGERILTRRGYHVTACAGPQEAFEAFSRAPSLYDLVVTDYSMPAESGVDLAVRMLAIRPETPILICTGYGAGLSREQLARLGIRGILQKPVALDELCRAVRQTLDSVTDELTEAPELRSF